jgi:hypothetical protein
MCNLINKKELLLKTIIYFVLRPFTHETIVTPHDYWAIYAIYVIQAICAITGAHTMRLLYDYYYRYLCINRLLSVVYWRLLGSLVAFFKMPSSSSDEKEMFTYYLFKKLVGRKMQEKIIEGNFGFILIFKEITSVDFLFWLENFRKPTLNL